MPASLKIPSGGVCSENLKIMIVGIVPEDSKENPEIIITGPDESEALHVKIGVLEDAVWRWAVPTNVTVGTVGAEGDGNSIDFDEPFIIM